MARHSRSESALYRTDYDACTGRPRSGSSSTTRTPALIEAFDYCDTAQSAMRRR